MRNTKRGLPIGRYTSQPLANFYLDEIDHYAKEVLHVRYYFRYCDDVLARFKTKDEAKRFLTVFDRMCINEDILIKHDAIMAKMGEGRNGRHRKRMRSHKR